MEHSLSKLCSIFYYYNMLSSKMIGKVRITILLLLSMPACALAQSADSTARPGIPDSTIRYSTLEEMVVTGVPMPVKMQNALAQYRIITREAMKAQGAVTVADALTTQLNINLGNDRVLGSNITMQGLGGDKVKVLIDGLPVNGRENGNIDLGQISLNNVARIEIVQGPMSVLYGSDALGGVINIITAKARKKAEAGAGFNYEDFGRYNADVYGAYRLGERHNLQGGGGRNYSSGFGYQDTSYPQRALIFKPKEQWLGNLAYRYTAPSGFGLSAASDFVQEKITARGPVNGWPYYASAVDEYYRTTRSNNRLMASGKWGSAAWRLDNGFAYYRRTRESRIKDLLTLQEVPSAIAGSHDTSRFEDLTLRSNYANSWGKLRYDGGYDLLFQHAQSGKFGGLSHAANNYALYANASTSFFNEKLTAQLGLRGAHNTVYSPPLVYAANILYKAGDRLQLRASYAKGFRAPSLKEQYLEFIDQNHHVIGNPNLRPEHGHHLQASASWQYSIKNGPRGGLTATGYYNDVRDQISLANPDADPTSINRIYGNIARQRNTVATLQAEGEWRRFYALVGGGITRTFAADSGYEAFNALEATATARYTLQPAKLVFSVFYKYTGPSRQLSALPDGTALYDSKLPAYSMLDASASRRFFKGRIDLTAGVKNILDIRSLTPTGPSTGVHGGSGGGDFLPRRVFATLRVGL
jgi:outer membrane receptor for ferrienterochelin and colicins